MSQSSGTSQVLSRAPNRGVPTKCWCGEKVVTFTSTTKDNPYRRFYRCGAAMQRKKENHLFTSTMVFAMVRLLLRVTTVRGLCTIVFPLPLVPCPLTTPLPLLTPPPFFATPLVSPPTFFAPPSLVSPSLFIPSPPLVSAPPFVSPPPSVTPPFVTPTLVSPPLIFPPLVLAINHNFVSLNLVSQYDLEGTLILCFPQIDLGLSEWDKNWFWLCVNFGLIFSG